MPGQVVRPDPARRCRRVPPEQRSDQWPQSEERRSGPNRRAEQQLGACAHLRPGSLKVLIEQRQHRPAPPPGTADDFVNVPRRRRLDGRSDARLHLVPLAPDRVRGRLKMQRLRQRDQVEAPGQVGARRRHRQGLVRAELLEQRPEDLQVDERGKVQRALLRSERAGLVQPVQAAALDDLGGPKGGQRARMRQVQVMRGGDGSGPGVGAFGFRQVTLLG